ncbi:MAG: hypothetical protein R2795_06110 [Saprospiraceae bacterium]
MAPWLLGTAEENARRVVRGGSWYFNDYYCQVSYRTTAIADYRFIDVGFRPARY